MAIDAPSKTYVRPRTPLVPGLSPLPPLDQYMVRMILPMMCVFRVEKEELRHVILQNLQIGLSGAIEEMPFLAANIVTESEDQQSIQLRYDDDAGVWFHRKNLPEIDFKSLSAKNFPFRSMTVQDFVPQPRGHSAVSPVLTVQATFITGGLVLTFNGHHAVMDAQGLGTFASVWSKHVAAAALGRKVRDEDRLGDVHLDGSTLYAPIMHRPLEDFSTYQTPKIRPYEEIQNTVKQTAIAGDFDGLAKLVRLTNWAVPDDKLQLLRQAVAPRTADQSSVTDNAAISALIWKHLTKARQLSKLQVATSSLLTAVNARRRMEPPLPMEYPGNVIVMSRATGTAEELEASSAESLHSVAQKIADSIDCWTPDEIWSLTGAIQACPNVANAIVPPLDYDVVVTSPSRLGDILGSAEWGLELGKIQALRFVFPAWIDGFAVVLPSIHGGVEITLWTSHTTTSRLEEDQSWLQWVSQLE